MPYKANEARRHRIPRARYRVTNWPEYDRALQQRGSLTVWVTPEALVAWHPPRTGQRGRPSTPGAGLDEGAGPDLCTNAVRPHSAPGYRPPAPEVAMPGTPMPLRHPNPTGSAPPATMHH